LPEKFKSIMNLENIPYSDFEEFKEESNSLNLREKVSKYLYHWPLFVISIALCLGLAFVHLKFSSPIYFVKAKLLIKDGANTETALSERDLFKGIKMIENEIEILKSKTLMKQVVTDLQLWTVYEFQNEFRTTDIYGSSPVHFNLLSSDQPLSGQVITIRIVNRDSFILKQPHSEQKVPFNTNLQNRFGVWRLTPTDHLNGFIGSTINIRLNDPDAVTHNYLGAVSVTLSRDQSTVVDLGIRDYVPERAENVINRLIVVYNSASVADKNKVSVSTLRFIEDRLASISGELMAVEKDVEGYKSSRGLTDLSSKSRIFLDNVQSNDARINEVKLQFEAINEIERYIRSADNRGIAPATVGITDPILLSLINRLMDLESQREKLLATVPEGNPIFQPINRQISATKRSISENIQGVKSSLRVTQSKLNNFNSSYQASIREIPGQEREFISIKRQQTIKEDLYIYLLQKREEAAVSYASITSGNRVVDSAYYVGQQSVNKPYTYALALIMGFILPGAFIFLRDLIKNRIESSRDIQTSVAVPILGEISFQKLDGLVVLQNLPDRLISEQFRALRTKLNYLHGPRDGGRVTLVTSGMPGDGKSFITTNLAAALANTGRKTIIVELDFRKPAILSSFGLDKPIGLNDYLSGRASKEEIVQHSEVNPNLFIIGAGQLSANPSELLEQSEMTGLIDWLRINFDEILIDTPPILLVTDAMILARYSDVNLYVIRQGYTHKSQLESVSQLWREHKLQKLNIVFNGVENRGTAYQYSYYKTQEKQGVKDRMNSFLKRF